MPTPQPTLLYVPNHDGTSRRSHERFFCAPDPVIGEVLSATQRIVRPGSWFHRLLGNAGGREEIVSFVGSDGIAEYRRRGAKIVSTLVWYGEVVDVRLGEVNLLRGSDRGVLHVFDFRGAFGHMRITGCVDESGLATTTDPYHFAMAALRAYRRYVEGRPASGNSGNSFGTLS